MTIDKDAARRLAIGYHAYLTAGPDNWQMWAKYLIKAQRDCGVEMLPVSTLLYEAPGEELAAPAIVAPAIAPDALDDTPFRYHARDDDEGEGGALVPAPKPTPRKPSPGASIASQAARFYAKSR